MTASKTTATDHAEEARQHTAITQSRHLVESAERARRGNMHTAAERYLRNVLEKLEGLESVAATELREKAKEGLEVSEF